MKKSLNGLRLFLFVLGLAIYVGIFLVDLGQAVPGGADVTNLSTDSFSVNPGSRQDLGGEITTIDLSVVQQDSAWKGYVGNITGTLALKNSNGYSLYEWSMNSSTMSGNVFVSRDGDITWASLVCANNASIETEQAFFGMVTADTDSINKTFNYTTHKAMEISQVGTIGASTCPSTATYVNGSLQSVTESVDFQEILLTDTSSIVFGTFIDQDSQGYDNNASSVNVTYDFQVIVAENSTTSEGTVYYFYADIR